MSICVTSCFNLANACLIFTRGAENKFTQLSGGEEFDNSSIITSAWHKLAFPCEIVPSFLSLLDSTKDQFTLSFYLQKRILKVSRLYARMVSFKFSRNPLVSEFGKAISPRTRETLAAEGITMYKYKVNYFSLVPKFRWTVSNESWI